MFNRIKRLWKLSKKDLKAIESLDKLTSGQFESLPDANDGNGKAVFLGEGTQKEFIEQENSDKGFKGIFGL